MALSVYGCDWQAGTGDPPAGMPLLVIVDSGSAPARTGWMYRLMSAPDMTKMQPGDIVQLWNEKRAGEMPDPEVCLGLVENAHALSLKVAYGGDMVDPATGWSYLPDMTVLTACDYYGLHATVRSAVPGKTMYGKPVIVTELEKDPDLPEDWARVVPWLSNCPVPAFFFTWKWRGGDSRLNLADHPDVVAAIVALNAGGTVSTPTPIENLDPETLAEDNLSLSLNQYQAQGNPITMDVVRQFATQLGVTGDLTTFLQMASDYEPQGETNMAVDINDPVIVDLKKQIADFTEGMRRIVEGKYNGAEGAAAIVVALEGGKDDSIQPQPDYAPKA